MAQLNSVIRSNVNRNDVNFSINYKTEQNRNNHYNDSIGNNGYPNGTAWHTEKDWSFTITCSDGNVGSASVLGGNTTHTTTGNCSYNSVEGLFIGSNTLSINVVFSWIEINGTWGFYGEATKVTGTTTNKNYTFPESTSYIEITNTSLVVSGYEQIPIYKKEFVAKDIDGDGEIWREDINGDGIFEPEIEIEGEWEDTDEIDRWEQGDPNRWTFTYYRRYVSAGSGSTSSNSNSASFNFYPSPQQFTFNNCTSGEQWRIDYGINSLIDNIRDFQQYATQYKHYKYGNPKNSNSLIGQELCPDWASPLSAVNLNSIYTYIGHSGGFSPGDKVAASMFNDAANIINE